MKRKKAFLSLLVYLLLIAALAEFVLSACKECDEEPKYHILLSSEEYHDDHIEGMWARLSSRVHTQPFNVVSLIVFLCAVIHTFSSRLFNILSNRLKRRFGEESFSVEFFRFMGEVEVVFGIWVVPLLLLMSWHYDWASALNYLNTRNYTEPLFVVIIMALVSTEPILSLVEDGLRFIAKIWKQSVTSWWWTILTIGPVLGSFITEPGAMTVSALLLGKQFYYLKPSRNLAYATLALLFVNISIGGVFTCFAAPPILMVSRKWGWDSEFMMNHFGFKALLGIVLANFVYYLIFRSEFKSLEKKRKDTQTVAEEQKKVIPPWIRVVHVLFLGWVVTHSQYPVVTIGSFLLFLGFYQATLPFQKQLSLKIPILVGFFIAGLVVHGGLQGWWISVILGNASEGALMLLSTVLTAFNDNAEITFLSTLIPTLTESMKYAIVAGAVTGGGLTVIANAPNPAGQAILSPYFGQGISAVRLFVFALIPTVIVGLCFYVIWTI